MLFCVIYLSPFTFLQHPGTGIDVRRRKIWNLYGGKTNLQVNINLVPRSHSVFHSLSLGRGRSGYEIRLIYVSASSINKHAERLIIDIETK